ncbi:NAD(P)H-dependent oxidoreductase [Reichenbachiella ulvae]|uniref:NAD(P)H-dependent oxidoreductase n=1 Tax=Reichenbachiella ulvae TaxID=2980104 RepID=A0ABT3CRX3_9BACT|nr:NAD(P)H-dependent oxidoreductase [Reichenbachiella ulvae]MCV9386456.1 NAD(P)H-dependent oxidoreductase [Reichenbachiella ulvae]
MKRKILIINGNPQSDSFCHALVEAYMKGANGTEVRKIEMSALEFDSNLKEGYKERQDWEPDLQEAMDQILWADHLVWVYPVWWYSLPAKMKGFIDRLFLPQVTFSFEKGSPLPKQLLKGKTGRIITTADSPKWYYDWFMKAPATHQLKRGTLQFCGVKPVKTAFFGPMKGASDKKLNRWLSKTEKMGRIDA